MNIKKIIGLALLLFSLYLGYIGISMFSSSEKSIDLVGIELSAEDSEQKTTSYTYLGFALASAIGGVVLLRSKKA